MTTIETVYGVQAPDAKPDTVYKFSIRVGRKAYQVVDNSTGNYLSYFQNLAEANAECRRLNGWEPEVEQPGNPYYHIWY